MANSPSLLSLLNANAHLTPDEIVAKLRQGDWVLGNNMTQALLDSWGNRRVVISPPGDTEVDEAWRANSFDLRGYNGSLGRYWFILRENYHESNPPPKPDGQSDA